VSSVTNNSEVQKLLFASSNNSEATFNNLKELFNSSVNNSSVERFNNIVSSLKESSKENNSERFNNTISELRELFSTSTVVSTNNSEKLNTTILQLKESFASNNSFVSGKESVASATNYEKFFDRVEKVIVKNITSDNLTQRIKENVSSLSTAIEKLSSFNVEKTNTSDRSVTIERIINNNFYSSAKESFKSMSLTDLQRTFQIPAFAQGGAVFGPTLAILGEGFGISRSNPEFVGTASQLKGIQSGVFDVNVSVDGELSFSMGKLAVALNREVRSQLRTSGKQPF
jgi:polyhydroxyalkanoate synthesis regulator phasin